KQQVALFISGPARGSILEFLSRLRQQRLQLFAPPDLSPQKPVRQKPWINSISNLVPQPSFTLVEYRPHVAEQLVATAFEIFNQQRLAFDARHDPRRDNVRDDADNAREYR